MTERIAITVDARAGFERVGATFGRMPKAVDRAMYRALRRLETWLKRKALQAASKASGVPQKFYQNAFRYHTDVTKDGLSVWIGTNPIAQHRLGVVKWSRSMRGARVGRRSFPGAWSWGRGRTGRAIMERTYGARRMPIQRVEDEQPHPDVLEAMARLQPAAVSHFDKLLGDQLNYALNIESRR